MPSETVTYTFVGALEYAVTSVITLVNPASEYHTNPTPLLLFILVCEPSRSKSPNPPPSSQALIVT